MYTKPNGEGELWDQTCVITPPERAESSEWNTPTTSESTFENLFNSFQPISLEETNKKARMLSRLDNKYVVDLVQFRSFLSCVKNEYAVLTIEGKRQFAYSSCYYDDEFGCYFNHHQGKRQRFKVRTRKYVNSGEIYFEIKLKGLRGLTIKHRIASQFLVTPKIEGEYLDMLRQLHHEHYKKEMPFELRPALMIGYTRCTLVAMRGGERVTIDYNLDFATPEQPDDPVKISDNFIVIETKSADGNGFADSILKKQKIRKAKKCSKYCIGISLTDSVKKNNLFLPTIKRVRENIVSRVKNFTPNKTDIQSVNSERRRPENTEETK